MVRQRWTAQRAIRSASVLGWAAAATVLVAAGAACAQEAETDPTTESDAEVTLPPLGGDHAVGTAVYLWIDQDRLEGATSEPGDYRQVRVQTWWPAETSNAPRAPYFDRPDLYEKAWRPGTQAFLENVRPAARLGAPVADAKSAYPVLIYSHGWNSTRSGATALMEGLASRGFIVVGVEHAYMGLVVGADGELTQPTEDHLSGPREISGTYGGDVAFVIDQLESQETQVSGRMRLSRIGAIGHSSGFIAAHRVCATDSRVAACANIDSPGPSISDIARLGKPAAVLRFERAPSSAMAGLSVDQRELVSVLNLEGANHLSNMDWGYLQAESEEDRLRAVEHLMEIAAFLDSFFSKALAE